MKRIAWQSVEIPAQLPKPDYLPLTGGYRRAPALQIGADVYCDTRLIAELAEQFQPEPSLFLGHARGRVLCQAIADWVESRLLWPTALYITGVNAEQFPLSFHTDRAALHYKSSPSMAQVKASAAKYLAPMRAGLVAIEALFTHEEPYVFGHAPSLADIAVYQIPWFLDTVAPGHGFLDEMQKTRSWMACVASLGRAPTAEISAEQAIELANNATPLAIDTTPSTAIPEGITLGDEVMVAPLEERTPASGRLVYASDSRISIAVQNARVRCVHVHFPRIGYRLARQ